MENNSQAIEIKGVVRNQTKIGVQDGQCDDIVNLRFKDGSWRVADDGKQVYTLPSGVQYKDLYVHTCTTYRHLLGVNPADSKLYWFANIDADGETFETLDTPVEICDVQGDVTIVQNGHLLTVLYEKIRNKSNRFYALFKTYSNEYIQLYVDVNGEQTDRGLYPFGRVCFNLDCNYDTKRDYVTYNEDAGRVDDPNAPLLTDKSLWHSALIESFRKCKEDNSFSSPFIALLAIKLYDGSYIYTSAPVLLNPRERYSSYKEINSDIPINDFDYIYFLRGGITKRNDDDLSEVKRADYGIAVKGNTTILVETAFVPCAYTGASFGITVLAGTQVFRNPLSATVLGARLIMTLDNTILKTLQGYEDLFSGISIFVTKESSLYYMGADEYKKGNIYIYKGVEGDKDSYLEYKNAAYKPGVRTYNEVINDLINSPFYLLKEYSTADILKFSNTSIEIDLSDHKRLLLDIEKQPILSNVSFDRATYSAECAYTYNSRLHIANYTSITFHGYPIDCFQLNNHNVKVNKGDFAIGGTLPDLTDGLELQHERGKWYFAESSNSHHSEDVIDDYIIAARQHKTCFAAISVNIRNKNGVCEVTRYIAPYNSNSKNTTGSYLDEEPFNYGDNANFYERLSPMLTYPDVRAEKMKIKLISLYENAVYVREQTFTLTPHPYLNMAYYIDPELKPILPETKKSIRLYEDFLNSSQIDDDFLPYKEYNIEELFANALKVSKTNNPFYFPYENTYQVGSSEIVALMSNAVAVGTGQTGAAPLYVFCKDGIYALLVDSSGEITYTNARIIARDVCNNAKSVTPIDSGVVFTTDRGLMTIAGSEVVEIGSAAEGDVFDITDTSDKAKKIMFNAFTMQQLAEFPPSLVDNTDFLTYLKGAIVNYNHNERELMVSNPDKDYTYVMDRNGNWSRRAFTAQEYVNNYPTSYRIDKDRNLFKVDADDNNTNQVYLLSNVIKLGTIAFKQAYRLIVRGYFETNIAAYGTINGTKVKVVGNFVDEKKHGEEFRLKYITKSNGAPYWVDYASESTVGIQILDVKNNRDITSSVAKTDSYTYYQFTVNRSAVGCYVFGSYDGRQWSLLGGNEKQGKFTDIGCKISHTDIRFLRVCLAGKLSKNTRIDYIEVSADGSALNGKLR